MSAPRSEYAERMADALVDEQDIGAIADLIDRNPIAAAQVVAMALREGPYVGRLRSHVMRDLLLEHCEAELVAVFDREFADAREDMDAAAAGLAQDDSGRRIAA